MCRIAAIVSRQSDALLTEISKMSETMQHGGPDGEGVFIQESLGIALAHRRLSIIDLSDTALQPLSYLDGKYWITYNGEIYNYKELRTELIEVGYHFYTNSDTEVLLAGYDHWREKLLDKLEGMFAFIIADIFNERLFIARDHMGIKPLYFGKYGGNYYFSSEIRGLLAIDSNWPPNLNWRIWFLTFGYLPEPMTTLENVRPIVKGSYMLFDLKTHEYSEILWFNPVFAEKKESREAAIAKTRVLLEESVKKHMTADVEVGVFLSGGIDSSIIATLAQEFSAKPIKTISIDFDDSKYSEKIYQEAVVAKINSEHHSFIVTEMDFVKEWKNIFDSIDQPSTDAINTYFICMYAKQIGLKVVLSGLGADEIFGGYPSFHRTNKIKKLQRLSTLINFVPSILLSYPNKKIDFLKKKIDSDEYLLYRGLFTPKDTAAILHIKESQVWKVLASYKLPDSLSNNVESKTRISILESDIYMLNQLLKDSDVQSMWRGLELRVPFLDKNLVEYVYSLEDNVKFPKAGHKFLLVEAFKSTLPEITWNRPKQGFNFPFDSWIKLIDHFKNSSFVSTKMYHQFLSGKINYSRLWAIFIINTFKKNINFDLVQPEQKPTNLFVYLSAFSQTGGIETVNRSLMYCLNGENGISAESYGLHDTVMDSRYFSRSFFKGFSGNRVKFMAYLFLNARRWKRVIVGHVNLSPSIYLMRLLNPKIEIWVVVHGIEAWKKQVRSKKWLLNVATKIISVSEYTKIQLVSKSNIQKGKINILSNCIDPFFSYPVNFSKPKYLQKRYQINDNEKVIFTLSRLSSKEKYKGYDKVIEALGRFKTITKIPFKYLLAGKADDKEFNRLQELVNYHQLNNQIILVGYVSKDELKDHYLLADLFIMPSKKEGFGIVFIESTACGTPVIAGNADGSTEALKNGLLGTLVNPNSTEEILDSIKLNLEFPKLTHEPLQALTMKHYHFSKYKKNFLELFNQQNSNS